MKELIARYFEVFNAGDAAAMLALVDDNIEHDINQGKTQFGKTKFEAFLHHMNACYKEDIKDLIIMVSDNGKNASAEFMVHGTYLKTDGTLPKASNQKYSIRAGSFFEIKNNKILRVSTYYNLPHWIELVTQ
ncbi:ketosteroid isomerase-related protein [Bacteriovorax sp. PP10]|uniref:Ketosteroid isomerase-related protein n=1 Tax=Bacteriovorax antarcticus TaxID=3088717 RepID=A0ABU5VS02_9BACT|nr:ketosteroid isomerase-related protein [Bacteriovorax sp. PP10]MEA9355692.1 ketosteroid isomerase-related protein [Bacteriovorax sp. PP10]